MEQTQDWNSPLLLRRREDDRRSKVRFIARATRLRAVHSSRVGGFLHKFIDCVTSYACAFLFFNNVLHHRLCSLCSVWRVLMRRQRRFRITFRLLSIVFSDHTLVVFFACILFFVQKATALD